MQVLTGHCNLSKAQFCEDQKFLFTKIQTEINFFSGTNELTALQQSVQQNCCFVLRENLLLAMLKYEDKFVRAKAVNIIQKIRNTEEGNQEGERYREFHLPTCNFAATSYTDPIIFKNNCCGNGVTYLTHKKDV